MRCLSPHSRYSIQVVEGVEQTMMDARGHAFSQIISKPVVADFEQGGLLDHEIEAALEFFNFSGVPEGINPLTRISFFDTEAYAERFPPENRAEVLEKIDSRLRDLQTRHPSEFIIVEHPTALAPWPSYDQDSVEDILEFQTRLQISPEKVRIYELENENRSEIVLAMQKQENPDETTAEEKIEVAA